jgi:formylglycine-generating enzyme required for sulfatase activity
MKVMTRTVRKSGLLAGLALTLLPWLVWPAGAQGPTLGITNDSTLGVSVFWPVAQAGYSLQWTPGLGAPITWQPYPLVPSLSEDGSMLVMPLASLQASSPQAFFELVSNAVAVPAAPTVVTLGAGPVNPTGAEVDGMVLPNGLDTTWWYQWGTNVTLGQTTSSGVVYGSNTAPVYVPVGLTGLMPSTAYYFQLYGSNSAGVSSGGELTFTTATPLPDAFVLTYAASNVTSSTAQLSGSVNPEGSILSGWFQWGTNTSYGSNTPNFYNISQNYQAVVESTVISNLAPNTIYYYRIIAYNDGPDEALGSNVEFMTSAPFQQSPPSVTTGSATPLSTTSETISGTINPNGLPTTGLFIYYAAGGGTISIPFSAGSGGSSVGYQTNLTGLMANTTYYYLIAANSSAGSSQGAVSNFTTGGAAQAPPSVLTGPATSVTMNSATLNAMVDPNGSTTAALFFYGPTPGLGMTPGTFLVGNNSSFDAVSNTIYGLTPNTTYYYTILANNFPGGSTYGVTNSFTTLCAEAPPTATTLAVAPSSITITSAVLSGLVYPNGSPATAYFEYGLSTNDYAIVSPPGVFSAGDNNNFPGQGATLGNLLPDTTYYYQIVAYNSCGETNFGGNGSFKTVNPTAGMVPIPAGSFTLGDTVDGGAPGLDNIPTATVTVSAFYMDTNLVSWSQWQTVYSWATNNGYAFVDPGLGKTANNPVVAVDWYNVVKWCNARSQKAGLTPVYYTDAGLTQVYTNGEIDITNANVNWNANGYRLPTEAEWERAARGGLSESQQRFPWGLTIMDGPASSGGQANYGGDTSAFPAYDLGPNGPNAVGQIGGWPYTSPVGSFAANNYGLYDMAGNAKEWCWDWYARPSPTYPTGSPYLGGSNPHGPATGIDRVLRGGSWEDTAAFARCANRDYQSPSFDEAYYGFRCVTGY